ncbi:synaptotagmin-4 isoform X1 [Hydra vulgaris]|uniref:synaptotagmin-4 isoform X1 n=1 Tax=Hydra vulgaris TaxID=6087 RepID=UPI001F5FBF26|nr:synaptotagmin-4-like isoform X1 [Hydra vulgaris]
MITAEVTLILAVTFLCVTLIFAVLTICKYLRIKKIESENREKYKKINFFNDSITYSKPFSIQAVHGQIPVDDDVSNRVMTKYPSQCTFEREYNHLKGRAKNNSINRNKICLNKRVRSQTIAVSDGNHPINLENSERRKRKPRKFSLGDLRMDFLGRDRSLSQIENKQRKISLGAIEHLKNQGKRVRKSDLRSHSELSSEDNNSQFENDSYDNDGASISTDSLLSDSDLSASSVSDTSVFESNSIYRHVDKRRLGSNRQYNQTHLLKRKKIGTIAMKAKLLSSNNTLEVWISRVVYFNKKQNCCLNAFIVLNLMPEKMQKQTSRRVKDSSEFNFDEQFFFQHLDVTQLDRYTLQIKLIKYNKIKKFQNEVIGEAQIPITDLSYSSEESNIYFDLFWHFKSKASLGSINISLCHQAIISKLNVIINQAKSLPKFSNFYVTVSLFREKKIEMKNTSIKYNLRDPIFNEPIEFEISTDISSPLSVYTLVVTVNNSNMLGKDRVIGHVIFSLLSPQKSAVTHWQLVQDSPHQSHSEWHTLLDPNEI